MIKMKQAFKELDTFGECSVALDALGATKAVVRLAKLYNCSPLEVLYSINRSATNNLDMPAAVMSRTLIAIVEGEN